MSTILVASGVALLASILFTPYLIRVFTRQGFGQEIRQEGDRGKVVAIHRGQLAQLVGADVAPHLGARRVDQRRLRGHAGGQAATLPMSDMSWPLKNN